MIICVLCFNHVVHYYTECNSKCVFSFTKFKVHHCYLIQKQSSIYKDIVTVTRKTVTNHIINLSFIFKDVYSNRNTIHYCVDYKKDFSLRHITMIA